MKNNLLNKILSRKEEKDFKSFLIKEIQQILNCSKDYAETIYEESKLRAIHDTERTARSDELVYIFWEAEELLDYLINV